MSSLTLQNVTKLFPGGVRAVDDLSLAVEDGELLVLVGSSGCGKTTTLRLIAGLERPSSGEIHIDGRPVDRLPPRRRDVAMVFQHPALYPHMSVRHNLGFGLRLRHTPRGEVRRRVDDVANLLGIGDLLRRRPISLSGGERQRVALGRAIVRDPDLFLLDEPLSSLDSVLRFRMQAELRRLHRRLGATMIHVTHDQTEAMTLGQRVAVMHEGRLQQVADPDTLYRRPVNRVVAAMIGSPPMNLLEGEIASRGGQPVFSRGQLKLPVPDAWAERLKAFWGKTVTLGVRPENVALAAAAGGPLEVEAVEPAGPEWFVHVDIALESLVARVDRRQVFRPGEPVDVTVAPGDLHFFDAETGRSLG